MLIFQIHASTLNHAQSLTARDIMYLSVMDEEDAVRALAVVASPPALDSKLAFCEDEFALRDDADDVFAEAAAETAAAEAAAMRAIAWSAASLDAASVEARKLGR